MNWIAQQLEQQVNRTPQSTALVHEDQRQTYAEMARHIHILENRLKALGVRAQTLIGINVSRSINSVISLITVLKMNCIFVPLDPSYPTDQLHYIVENSSLNIIITERQYQPLWSKYQSQVHIVLVHETVEDTITESSTLSKITCQEDQPSDVAYIIYTSGSSGRPKGVLGTMKGLQNRFQWMWERYPFIRNEEVCCHKTALNFADCLWEVLGGLLKGIPLVILPMQVEKDPYEMTELMIRYQVSRFVTVPSFLKILLNLPKVTLKNWIHLKYLTSSGEALPVSVTRQFFQVFPNATLLNLYGSTEISADAAAFSVNKQTLAEIDQTENYLPIGTPISNTTVYVLSEDQKIQTTGELYIGGVGLARGYLNNPQLTAQCFIENPFLSDDQRAHSKAIGRDTRLYRTGDLVRYLPDGNLQYIGRIDNQVKIRGHRVELGEIESILKAESIVNDVVVIARSLRSTPITQDDLDNRVLIVYVKTTAEHFQSRAQHISVLNNRAKKMLPSYMMPSAFVLLTEFPLTPSGKIDRLSLPDPTIHDRVQAQLHIEPRTEIERNVGRIWCDLLSIEQVSIKDNFFHLGGHSLLAIQLISRLRQQYQVELGIRQLMQDASLAAVCSHIEQYQASITNEQVERTKDKYKSIPMEPVDRAGSLPLSFSQQRLWFIDQFSGGQSIQYSVPIGFHLNGQFEVTSFRYALADMIERHESLRTVFIQRNEDSSKNVNDVEQIIVMNIESMLAFELKEVGNDDVILSNEIQEEIERPFSLHQGPLLRTSLYRIDSTKHLLLFVFHHIIIDGWSLGIFLRELSFFYRKRCETNTALPESLVPISLDYVDFTVWQRKWLTGNVFDEQVKYWKMKLSEVPETTGFPLDRATRPTIMSNRGSTMTIRVCPSLVTSLQRMAQQLNTTLFATMLAAFGILVHRYTCQDDLIIGIPMANRQYPNADHMIGLFVNTVPVRMICRNNPTFVEFLGQVSETLMEAQEHQDLPFDQLIDQLRIKRTLSYNSLLQIMFDFEYLSTSPLNDFRLSEQLQLSIAPLVRRTCVFDFSLTVREEYSNNREDICQQLSLELEYNTELYAELTVFAIGNHLINLLQSIVVNSEESIRQFSIISKEDIGNVEKNDQLISPPSDSMLLVHEMFEQEANIRPHVCAVSYLHQTISYGELNELSYRMAKYLVQCGVQNETIVAVCLDRSINLISVILAVLKAGGAFLPIDCQIPPARMQAILVHSGCRFVIAERRFYPFLDLIIDEAKVSLIEMETFEAQMHRIENDDPNLPTIKDHHLAYAIYTSGSTGVPKGVMIEHKNLRSIAHAWKRIYKLSAEMHHLQMANVAFDVFIGDLVRALGFGARLVLCPREILMQPNDLLALIERESITCAEFVPVILRAIFENTTFLERKNRLKSLSLLICGSEKWLLNEYENIRQSLRHDARLVSSYGLTEATIDSTYFECKPLQWQDEVFTVPIGIPFPGIFVYVLDESLMCVPRGVTGELFIGGPGVARGYLNNQPLTNERFIINPFHQIQSTTQHRLYRTGDLVRYLSDGQTLQFVGRLDEQVKLRGYRVELIEIESVLAQVTNVRETIVIARQDRANQTVLVAYILMRELLNENQNNEIEKKNSIRLTLCEQAIQHLPTYMVPNAFVLLDAFPLLPNGKINRKALPLPTDIDRLLDRASVECIAQAETPLEHTLLTIWRRMLHADTIGIDDNFFQLGGDSILGIQLISSIRRQCGMIMTIRQLFDAPTIRKLAKQLLPFSSPSSCLDRVETNLPSQSKCCSSIIDVHKGGELCFNDSRIIPLTPIQCWFFEQKFNDFNHFNQSILLRVNEAVHVDRVNLALRYLVNVHDAFRFRYEFAADSRQWVQRCLPVSKDSLFCSLLHLTSDFSSADSVALIQQIVSSLQSKLNIEHGPILAGILINWENEQRLYLVIHHLITDGVSWRILLEDFEEILAWFQDDEKQTVSSFELNRTSSFRDWAISLYNHAQTANTIGQLGFWLNQTEVHYELPTIEPDIPADISNHILKTTITVNFDVQETQQLLTCLSSFEMIININALFLTALAIALAEWTKSNVLMINLESHGRYPLDDVIDISRTIGWFTSEYPVRFDLPSTRDLTSVLLSIHEQLSRIPQNGIGYSILRYITFPNNQQTHLPSTFYRDPIVNFNYMGHWSMEGEQQKRRFSIIDDTIGCDVSHENDRHTSDKLQIEGCIINGKLRFTWTFDRNRYHSSALQIVSERFRAVLCRFGRKDEPPTDKHKHLIYSTALTEVKTYSLSPMQSGMLYRALQYPHSDEYLVQTLFTLTGHVDSQRVEHAWQNLLDFHDILRSTFHWNDVLEPCQRVEHVGIHIPFQFIDWSIDTNHQTDQITWENMKIEEFLINQRQQLFDLQTAPLCRVTLIKLFSHQYLLIFSHHHILLDGWSTPLLIDQFIDEYNQSHSSKYIGPQYSHFIDYIHQQRQHSLLDLKTFWQEYLQNLNEPCHLTAVFRHLPATVDGSLIEQEHHELNVNLSDQLLESINMFCRHHAITVSALFLGCWAIVLSRYLQRSDIVFGITISGRTVPIPTIEYAIGLFINTIPLRIKIDCNQSIEILTFVQQQLGMIQEMGNVVSLAEIQSWNSSLTSQSLFDTLFVIENYPVSSHRQTDSFQCQRHALGEIEKAEYPLTVCVMSESDHQIQLTLNYKKNSFRSPLIIERLAQHYINVIRNVLTDPISSPHHIGLLSNDELEEQLIKWNHHPIDNAWHVTNPIATIHGLVEESARHHSQRLAIIHNQRSITYEELNKAANRLAHFLIDNRYVQEIENLVVVLFDRSIHFFIAILAVLKAGGAYVPIDTSTPEERLLFIIDDTQTRLLLVGSKEQEYNYREHLPAHVNVLVIDDVLTESDAFCSLSEQTPLSPLNIATSRNLAYVIYTSGSTGTPKGVLIEHAGICVVTDFFRKHFCISENSRILQFFSYSFDGSVSEYFMCFTAGATLVLPLYEMLDAPAVASHISLYAIDVITLPPSIISTIFNVASITSLRTLVVAGDSFLGTIPRSTSSSTRIINAYGPSEGTIITTSFLLPTSQQTFNNIVGKVIDTKYAYVLDTNMQPVPIQCSGELYIGGVGLARGYLNNPTLTSQRFIENPFFNDDQRAHFKAIGRDTRLYRTGDLVRYLPDGNLQYIGRIDNQVKIRGHRVELGEIESVLKAESIVNDVVVIARSLRSTSATHDDLENKVLIAYVKTTAEHLQSRAEHISVLNTRAKKMLPSYMMLSAFVLLTEFPLTPSGKIDRLSLPDPTVQDRVQAQLHIEPSTEIERHVARIWCDLLSIEQVSINDNFFHLGGHSLLAIQLISRLRRQYQVELGIRQLMQDASLAAVCSHIEQYQTSITNEQVERTKDKYKSITIERVDRAGSLPLSFSQQRLWFIDQFSGGQSIQYNVPIGFHLKGQFEVTSFRYALADIIERHESLRTVFIQRNEESSKNVNDVEQIIVPNIESMLAFELKEVGNDDIHLSNVIQDEIERPFSLHRGPLLRTSLYRIDNTTHLLLFVFHHIIIDGWSLGIFLRELSFFYRKRCETNPELTESLVPISLDYVDFTVWQRKWLTGIVVDEQVKYWKIKLSEAPETTGFPFDRATRPTIISNRGSTMTIRVCPSLVTSLQHMAQQLNTTLFATMLAAFGILVHRYTCQDDLIIGIPMANRQYPNVDHMIGLFVNTLPVRMICRNNPTFVEFLGQVSETLMEAQEHQDLPFDQLIDQLRIKRTLSYNSLCQILFNVDLSNEFDLVLDGTTAVRMNSSNNTFSSFDLSVTVQWAEGKDLHVDFEYNIDLYKSETIEVIANRYVWVLGFVTRANEVRIQHAAMGPSTSTESMFMKDEESFSLRLFGQHVLLQDLFERRAVAYPDEIALICIRRSFTRKELAQRTNQLCRYLQQMNVLPRSHVGILLSRSCEYVLTMLAVLKCGAAYIPLDDKMPKERLAYIVQSSGISCIITEKKFSALFDDILCTMVQLDAIQNCLNAESTDSVMRINTDHDLAYVIFTSGSSGKPKGVMIYHRAIVERILSLEIHLPFSNGDCLLNVVSFTFDVAAVDIYLSLHLGAKLVISDDEAQANPQRLLQIMTSFDVTAMQATPATWNMLISSKLDLTILRTVRMVTTGEAITPKLAAYLIRFGDLHNLYGPTETTIYCTMYHIQDPEQILIGKPLTNVIVVVLDEYNQLVPDGCPGELYIGGVGLARGYLNNPTLTAQCFVENPFFNDDQRAHFKAIGRDTRLYRTGDLVRYLPDGNLQYIGRIDNQVKIRGHRVELGEIENVLKAEAIVDDIVVIARSLRSTSTIHDDLDNKVLIAYVKTTAEHLQSRAEHISVLNNRAKKMLPSYMMPSAFVLLTEFPLTPSVKIDRLSLPDPTIHDRVQAQLHIEPRTEIERHVARIWCDLLSIEQVSINDNFFHLGGTSLLIMKLYVLYQSEFNLCSVNIASLFGQATIVEHAELIGLAISTMQEWKPSTIAEARASFSQEDCWLADQSFKNIDSNGHCLSIYHIIVCYNVKNGHVSLEKVRLSLDSIVKRHSIFRTSLYFDLEDAYVKQKIISADGDLRRHYALVISTTENDDELKRILQDEESNNSHFDLNQAQALRLHIINRSDGRQLLLFNFHHCMFDGHSIDLFMDEFIRIYRYGASDSDHLLPKLRYIDYSVYERSMDMSMAREFWKKTLLGYPFDKQLSLPFDNQRMLATSRRTGQAATHDFLLRQETSQTMVEYAQKHHITLYQLGLTCFYLFLHILTGEDDICVETLIANRYRSELQSVIGLFSNNLPCRIEFDRRPSWTFAQFVDEVKQCFLNVVEHAHYPYSKVVELHRLETSCPLLQAPFVGILFVVTTVTDDEDKTMILDDEHRQLVACNDLPQNTCLEDLEIDMNYHMTNHIITYTVNHSLDLFHSTTGKLMGQRFGHLLDQIFHPNMDRIHDTHIINKLNLVLDNEQTIIDRLSISRNFLPLCCSVSPLPSPQKICLIMGQQSLSFAEFCTYMQSPFEITDASCRLEIVIKACADTIKSLQHQEMSVSSKMFQNDVILLDLSLECIPKFATYLLFGNTLTIEPTLQEKEFVTCVVTRTGSQWYGKTLPRMRKFCWLSGAGSCVLRMHSVRSFHVKFSDCLLFHLYTIASSRSILSVKQIIVSTERNDVDIISIGDDLLIGCTILDDRFQPLWANKSGQLYVNQVPTGDLMKYDSTGQLFYMGPKKDELIVNNHRIDHHRIIETILDVGLSRNIIDCLVKKTENLFVAYLLVPCMFGNTKNDLLYHVWSHCRYHLETRFIPDAWSIVVANEWPLDKKGCIDWSCLSQCNEINRTVYPPSRSLNQLEQQLRYIFARALQLQTDEEVDVHASFLEHCGGCSLRLMHAVALIRESIYPHIDANLFYENPSVVMLANAIQRQIDRLFF